MKLETKIGVFALHPTSTEHVYCSSDSGVTIRNVPYHGSIHFYKWSDGIFRAGLEYIEHDSNGRAIPRRLATGYERRTSVYLRRAGTLQDTPSNPAWNTFVETLTPLVNDWIRSNPSAIKSAEIDRLQTELEKARAKQTELCEALSDTRQRIADLTAELERIA